MAPKIGEMIVKAVILSGSIFLFFASSQFKQFASYEGIGPEFWPQMVLAGVIALTGAGLARDLVTYLRRDSGPVSQDEAAGSSRLILILAVVVAVCYVFGMQWMGFLVGTVLFQAAFMYVLRVRSILSIGLVTAVNTGMLFGIFVKLLSMPLPRGVGVLRDLSLLFY